VVYRVGDSKPERCDIRIVCATHRNLDEMIREGSFREDLYYRLVKYPIILPPLRERQVDIPILATELVQLHAQEYKVEVETVHRETMKVFCDYGWPGNVRELNDDIDLAVSCHPKQIRRALHHREFPMNLQAKFGLAKRKARPPRGEVGGAILKNLLDQGPLNVNAISQSLGCSPSTVKDALRALEREGRINIDHRPGRKGNTVRLAERDERPHD